MNKTLLPFFGNLEIELSGNCSWLAQSANRKQDKSLPPIIIHTKHTHDFITWKRLNVREAKSLTEQYSAILSAKQIKLSRLFQ
jgi:hypothetical protein